MRLFNGDRGLGMMYRYEQRLYTDGIHVQLNEYPILRTTPKGAWVDNYGGERFVLFGARKQFAHSTIAEAALSFAARKKRHIQILTTQLNHAKEALTLIEQGKESDSLIGLRLDRQ